MKIGTRSVLYGAHCFFLHPFFVALAWVRLFGIRKVHDPYVGKVSILNPMLWLAFFVHDIGYIGKPNMDGPEGEEHPAFGAWIMSRTAKLPNAIRHTYYTRVKGWPFWVDKIAETGDGMLITRWGAFVYYHSRFLSKRDRKPYSMLCVADKLAVALEPVWLYLPRVRATGELQEYMSWAGVFNPNSKYAGEPETPFEKSGADLSIPRNWARHMMQYCRAWAFEHRDGKKDQWTPEIDREKGEIKAKVILREGEEIVNGHKTGK